MTDEFDEYFRRLPIDDALSFSLQTLNTKHIIEIYLAMISLNFLRIASDLQKRSCERILKKLGL